MLTVFAAMATRPTRRTGIADAPCPLSLMVSMVEIAYSCNLLRLLCTL
jgi:hypothetical protein